MAISRVIAELPSFTDDSRWAIVERPDGQGPGVSVHYPVARVADGRVERLAGWKDSLVAPLIDHGVDAAGAFILWDGTLDDTLATLSGPLSMGEIAVLADVLLGGLEHLHAAGFVHPGLTAELVRLRIDDLGRSIPEVVGFGVPVPAGRVARDDIRDVGALLYQLFTGRPPFLDGERTDGSVVPLPFAEVRPGIVAPVAFEAAILRSLGPVAGRFVTAAEMRAALAVAPVRRTGFQARPAATTDPHMRRALTSGVVGLEGLLAPELTPLTAEARRAPAAALEAEAPRRPSVGLVAGIAAAALVVGFLLGRVTAGGGEGAAVAANEPQAVAAAPLRVAPTPAPGPAAALAPTLAPGGAAVAPAPADPTAVVAKGPEGAPSAPQPEAKSPEPKPGESKPGESKPAEPKPADAKPAEPKPTDKDTKASDTKPSEKKPADKKPEEAKPADKKPEEAPAEPAGPMVRLRVETEPPGAIVLVRGHKILRKTPVTLEVSPDWLPIELAFDKKGYYGWREFVRSLSGGETMVSIKLRRRE